MLFRSGGRLVTVGLELTAAGAGVAIGAEAPDFESQPVRPHPSKPSITTTDVTARCRKISGMISSLIEGSTI